MDLLEHALAAREKAYVPYSKFQVGAALETDNGTIITGCNVENASYGLSVCAERNAVFSAISKAGPGLRIKLAVIFTPTPQPTTPCGACRQVLQEFCDDIRIISACNGDAVFVGRLSELFSNPPQFE